MKGRASWEGQGEEWKHQPEEPEFQVSEKVVCVNAEIDADQRMNFSEALIPGKIYVVRESSPGRVLLVGILGSPYKTLVEHEYGFRADRFVSLENYRYQRANARRINGELKEIEAYWREVRACDADGNPRVKKTRKSKADPVPPPHPESNEI